MATYCYCLVQRRHAPSVVNAPKGLTGVRALRALKAGESLWLVAADAPLERYGAEAIERGLKDLGWVSACAVAHERVVEHFVRSETVIPMKLFTLFSNDERAVSHIHALRNTLRRVIERVRGCQEWGVRVSLGGRGTRKSRDGRPGVAPAQPATGTQFLLQKKQQQDASRRRLAEGQEQGERAFKLLSTHAKDSRQRPILSGEGGAHLLLDAAFLVPSKSRGFKTAAREIARRLAADGYRLTLNGPWPPYNFVM